MQRLRHLLGGVLALVGVCGLPAVDNFDPLWSFAALAGILLALVMPRMFAGRGERFWARVGMVLFAYAVADLILSGILNRQYILGAVIRVSLMILTLRTMQPRRRREDMQLIVLAMFLAAVGGSLSLSPVFAVQVFLFIPISGGILFLINRFEDTPGATPPEAHWKDFRWHELLSHVREAWGWRFGAFLAGCVGVVVLCGALIFGLLPRFRMGGEVPFLELPGSGKTGVSEAMSLGSVSELVQDSALAFRVDTPGRKRPAVSPYWRIHVLDRYRTGADESGFALSATGGAEETFAGPCRGGIWLSGASGAVTPSPLFSRGEWLVHLEPNVSRYLPLGGAVARTRFDTPQEWRESAALRSMRLEKVPSTPMHMQMELRGDLAEHSPPATELARLRALSVPSEFRYPGTLLALPNDELARLALDDVVREATGGETLSTRELADRLSAWLQSRHAYALRDGYAVRVPPAGQPGDYLVRWMRSGATGWCEHFAGSFVLMARAAGRPARLVTGFSGGEWNESDNYLVVRMKHAHAWCEVFDRETGYWLRVDPTPAGFGVAGGTEAQSSRVIGSFSGLAAWYDGVTMLWFRNVVNFEESDQRRIAKSLADTLAAWRTSLDATVHAWRGSIADTWSRWRAAPLEAAPPIAAAILTLIVARLLVRLRARSRLRRFKSGDADSAVVRDYRRRAGRLLVRIDNRPAGRRPYPAELRAAVESVRYGRPSEWGDADDILSAAARELRG